ncbi:hypothetical protein [Gilvimarinus algae]|uniref:Uncharacterized protein n=1 Tax=Gilvimarinus algae TaxID=3058037 RepID=A0ABT8TAR2_9GAMM|nr:hypothetical protein [Gilvimarinus sp. SDUM040014]MDO3381202.1 hypothetical protein [Gilvimarinus sp. SDUM040014]
MISKIFKKDKPRVYLDKMLVASRDEFEKTDEWGIFKSEDLEDGVREKLDGIFCLPPISTRQDSKKSDLALELVVLKVRGGEFEGVDFGLLGFAPIFWRPKIELAARLYYLDSGKTHSTYKAKEIMRWGEYFSGVFSLRGFFRYKPIFGPKNLEPILYKACEKLLFKMVNGI